MKLILILAVLAGSTLSGVVGMGGPSLGHAHRLPVGGVLEAFFVDAADQSGEATT